jgi:hypothetical protein
LSSSTRRAPRSSWRWRGLVELGAELGEGFQFAVGGQVQSQRAGDLLHGLGLGVAAHARHADADVDGRADAGEEQVGLEVDLPVGDADDVGRDVGRHFAFLGLDDRQGGQRAAAVLVGELDGALEQAAVQIEHVAGIGFAAGRAAQQQRKLAIGGGLLGQVVVDAQRVPRPST